MQTITEQKNDNEDEYLAAKLATILFNSGDSSEWDTWSSILQKEPFKSNMDSILYNILKFVVFLDVSIDDVWFKYVTSVRPKLEEANLVDQITLDENENKLKTLIYSSRVKFDLISKLANAIGAKEYALSRFENNPNKEKIITQLTAGILGRKFAQYWESEIETRVNLISEQFIATDLVNLKNHLKDIKTITEAHKYSDLLSKGEKLKQLFSLKLREEELALLKKFEQNCVKVNLPLDEYIFSTAFNKKGDAACNVISMVIDKIIENER